MEIKQIVVTVRGTKGEAKQVVLDASGKPLRGDEGILAGVRTALGGNSSAAPAGPTRVTRGASEGNTVVDAQPSENTVVDAQPSENS